MKPWRTSLWALMIAFIFVAPLFLVHEEAEFKVLSPALAEESAAKKMNASKIKQIKAGRGKAQLCTRCHGRLGMLHAISKNDYEGTVEAFVIKELVDFRTGARVHAVMTSISQTLSDQDINDVAAWYQAVSIKR